MNEFEISTGEAVLFWVLGPLSVIGALSLLFARRIVHIAVSIAGVMVALAILYVALEAPFLGIAQIVVYTGAVMMLFLFVIMLVGVDSSESLTETLKGQRWIAVIGGLGLVALFAAIVTTGAFPTPAGLGEANAGTNPAGVAQIIFGKYIYPFELTAALLITAALGALVLSHRRRIGPKRGQKEIAEGKLAALSATGDARAVISAPGPGVYARTNSADMPAIDAQGRTLDASVTSVLRVRGQVHGQSDATEATGRVALIATGAPVLESETRAPTPGDESGAPQNDGGEPGDADGDVPGDAVADSEEGQQR